MRRIAYSGWRAFAEGVSRSNWKLVSDVLKPDGSPFVAERCRPVSDGCAAQAGCASMCHPDFLKDHGHRRSDPVMVFRTHVSCPYPVEVFICRNITPMQHPVFKSLDHLAIVVENTQEALAIWRDGVGLTVLFSEVVNDGTVRLTHLDLGNTHLQLVEPLTDDHPLKHWLNEHGSGLHHFCLQVDDVQEAFEKLPEQGLPVAASIHQGTKGKRALFMDASKTGGVIVEVTGA